MNTEKTKSVLIIEDDPDLREIGTTVFQMAGYEVSIAADGFHAIKKATQQAFDVIVCDINLSKMNGDKAILEIAKTDLNSTTPVIVVSGYLDEEVILNLRRKIVKAFTKPVDMQEILEFADGLIK